MNPLISVITPCYNASPFITQTIESVLSQTYPYWEMLIVDDCSTDRSAEIIQTYVERDTRIRYLRTENPSGQSVAAKEYWTSTSAGRIYRLLG